MVWKYCYNLTILLRPGSKNCNVDGPSRIPDDTQYCDCYQAGVNLKDPPCKGCAYYKRAQQNQSRFEEEVHSVVPLAVNRIYLDSSSFIQPLIIRIIGDTHVMPSPKKNIGAQMYDSKRVEQADDLTSQYDSSTASSYNSDKESKGTHKRGMSWVPTYVSPKLCNAQLSNPDLCEIIEWLEHEEQPLHKQFLTTPTD